MSTFALRKLVVSGDCGPFLKVLKPGEYLFSDPEYDGFFSDGVVIQAIVGKNGSGKSSLLDMLFRMSNNLAALMCRGYERPAAEQVYFIKNVVAELVYTIDKKEGRLLCKKKGVELLFDNESFEWEIEKLDCQHKIAGQVVNNEPRFPKEVKAASSFFYTIATNYSVQAYISNDYAPEQVLAWDDDHQKWKDAADASSWIDGVFHKNDGYMSPIVLNPYRHNGTIDMAKEENLTINRLCSILWETQSLPDDGQMIEGYRLNDIVYRYDEVSLLKKFDEKLLNELPGDSLSGKFCHSYFNHNSIAKTVLEEYGFPLDVAMSEVETILRVYLTYKILCIAGKYPSYGHFRSIGDVNNVFHSSNMEYDHKLARELVRQIKNDGSHITLKIRQTQELIEKLTTVAAKRLLEGGFSYRDYVKTFALPEKEQFVEMRNEHLPPPVFKAEIEVIKCDVYNQIVRTVHDGKDFDQRCKEAAIRLNDLSSGERQLIYLASTLVYHAFNLKSIPAKTRIKYEHVLMILDEIEICFHPDYQRTFISKLLALINRMKLTDTLGINVLVVTHSPFILSDIPQGNIMYLKAGHQLTRDEMVAEGISNPFCANINDILHQSFFLDKGFVGEFARQKVISLLDYLKEGKNGNVWDQKMAKIFIDEIGEPIVREHLLNLYIEKFALDKRRKIEIYRAEIERLEKE